MGLSGRIGQAVDVQFNSIWKLNHDIANKDDNIIDISRRVLPRAKAGECKRSLSDLNM